MKAAVCHEFGKPLVIEEVTLAEPGPGSVQVTLKACAICHSDLSYADGEWGGTLPAVYGHEGAGIVTATGEGVSKVKAGDHVVVTLVRHCGDCHYCRQSAEVLCEGELELDRSVPITDANGKEIHQAMACGAFAEAVLVDQSQVESVPKDMPFDTASLLACGVITGYGAVKHASGLSKGQHVAVIGCGGVGLNSVQGAALAGAASVIAIDLEPEKLDIAKRFGATHAIDPRDPDSVAKVMAITGNRGVDHVFVTVGAKAAIDSAQGYITKNGTVIVVGMPANGVRSDYDPQSLTAWGQKIVGTKMGNAIISQDIPELVGLYNEGRYQLDSLISGRFSLDEINEALDQVRQGKAIKNVIVFD